MDRLRSRQDAVQQHLATDSHEQPVQLAGKGIFRTAPEGTVYLGSHYTDSVHDQSFANHGILPTYGDNFNGELQYGEGFYFTDDQQGDRWGNIDPQAGPEGLIRRWDVYIDQQDLQQLQGITSSEIPRPHQWQKTPYTNDGTLRPYITHYDYIVDQYVNEDTQKTVHDFKFNPRALQYLYLVPHGFFDDIVPDNQVLQNQVLDDLDPEDLDPSALYAEAWTEYKINTRRF